MFGAPADPSRSGQDPPADQPEPGSGGCLEPVASGDFGQALRALVRAYDANTKTICTDVPSGLKGLYVLSVVAEQPCRNQASIADVLSMDRTVVTHTIDDLERAGLVERRPDPRDRRARQIVLTEEGRVRLDAGAAAMGEAERRMLQTLDDAEAETFRALLRRVADAATASCAQAGAAAPAAGDAAC